LKLSEKEINKIISFSEKNILLSDVAISQQLSKLKMFERYKGVFERESLRRSISTIRTHYGLRDVAEVTDKLIEKVIKDYPNLTSKQQAVKLSFRLKNRLAPHSLRLYIMNYKNYGTHKI